MNVTKIETWVCRRNEELFDPSHAGKSPMPWDVVVMKVTTDAGLESTVTAMAARSGNITQDYLQELVAPVVLGRDITEREAIWHDLWLVDRHITFFPNFLPGPIDIALWDLAARAAGLPLYQYLGSYRQSLPVYASSLFMDSPEKYVEEARSYMNRGIMAYKVHVPGEWRRDMDVHRALREELGEDVVLMSDPVGDYSLGEAIRVGRDLERLNYHWYEEPFRDFQLTKYAKLCAALDIPIAGTETTRGGHWGVAEAIAHDAVDIVRADVSWKPGVTGALKVAHLAEAHGLRCEIHTAMGPMDMANLHVACAIKNCEYFELLVPEEKFTFPLNHTYPIHDSGTIHVPETPGIGAAFDWDAIDDTCIDYQIQEV